MSDIKTITSMLSYRRPAGTGTEAEFIERFLYPLGVEQDKFGNYFVVVGGDRSVLWSSHTDSVHSSEGLQKVEFDGQFIRLPKNSKSNCLGADDAAGVWLMTEMIIANVPGLYVFHFGEECGTIGSGAIAKDNPGFLDGVNAAIAFDRKGTTSVITHQGSRCCSDAFGRSLANQLPGVFRLDSTGILTDTKRYMKLVPECTNLSVGYYHEHTSDERLDINHLIAMRDHLVKIDCSKLIIERDHKAVTMPMAYPNYGLGRLRAHTIGDLVWTYPSQVSEFLEDHGITFDELNDYIQDSGQSAA